MFHFQYQRKKNIFDVSIEIDHFSCLYDYRTGNGCVALKIVFIAEKIIKNEMLQHIVFFCSSNRLFNLTYIKVFILLNVILNLKASFLNGIDGYYYFLQIESFSQTGTFYFPTQTPVVLGFFSAINFFVGDPIYSIKTGTLLFQLFLYFGLFTLTKELTKSRWLGIITVSLVIISGLHRYMLVEYLSQLGAIVFLIWAVAGIIKYADSKRKLWLVTSGILLFLAIGSHRSIIPFVIVGFWSFSLWALFLRARKNENSSQQILILIACLVSIAFPAIIVLSNSWLSSPIEIQNNLTAFPKLPFRLSTLPEILLLLIFSPFCLWLMFSKQSEQLSQTFKYTIGTIALFSILLTLNPFLSSDLGFSSLGGRLRVLSFIQVAILVPGAVLLVNERWKEKKINRLLLGLIAAIILPMLIWSYSLPLPRGIQKDFLETRENMIQGLENNKQNLDKDSIIIANHGQQFLVTAITGITSQQTYPKDTENKPIYWLVEGVATTLLDKSMLVLFKDARGQNTVIVKDDESWKARLSNPVFNEPIRRNNRHIDVYLANP